MNRLLYIALYSSLLLAFTACTSDDAVQENNDTDKSPIELTVGIADGGFNSRSASRAITDGTGKTMRAFTGTTRLFFAMVADDADDSHKKYGFNYGTAAGVVDSKNTISFNNNALYWDDAYARDTKLSIYSIAVANKERGRVDLSDGGNIKIGTDDQSAVKRKPFQTYTTAPTPTFVWSIGGTTSSTENIQNEETFIWQDLVFSNNIAKHSETNDKRLKYNTDEGDNYRKFDKGELIYYHALSQFTIKIMCGDGFKGDGSDFKFTDYVSDANNSFALNGFYGAEGVFLIGTGVFQTLGAGNIRNYTSIYKASEKQQKAAQGAYYTLKAYVYPGTDMTGSKDDAFSFTIDGNKYDISLATLYNAIKNGATNVDKKGHSPAEVDPSILDGGNKLKAGVNYEFTFTVEKTKISSITAQVVDWENVQAEHTPSNARINIQLEDRSGEEVTNYIDFYRAKDNGNTAISDTYEGYKWSAGYENGSDATYDPETKWTTPNWYWPDNTTFYHFRAVGDKSTSSPAAPTVSEDKFTLTAGETYKDYIWGAPFKDIESTAKLKYSTTYGFDGTYDGTNAATHQIYKAIGPTKDRIKLLMFHMMSDVTFEVKSTDVTSAEVQLGDGSNENCTTIELQNIYTGGKVLLGNGLVIGTDTRTNNNYTFTTHPAPSSGIITWANYGAIPQSLDGVILVITTPDHNQYKVDMKEIVASNKSNNNITYPAYPGNKVNYWYPGVKYTYTFTLKKKGISDITATILNWEEVTAGNDEVTIK